MAKKEEIVSFLREWTSSYIKHRDMLTKNITNIKEEQDRVVVKFKDKEQVFLIRPTADDSVIQEINKDKNIGIVMLNSRENLDFLIKNWRKLIKFEKLTLFFINPFSEPDKKWLISPYTHNKICDKDSLKLGLKTMFETVEPITEKKIMKKI
ncbi:MAG: hypothetical protein KJ968_03255 [Nanoarchaeota archaeon]|nr:hypothetical protein [Nanoarchaeota archaeon]